MKKMLFAVVEAMLSCSSAQAQYSRQDRFERNFQRCVEDRVERARLTRREMRSIREHCRHRAAVRTERQSHRAARDRPLYVPQPVRQVRPLDRY